jgi:hypothetical protein
MEAEKLFKDSGICDEVKKMENVTVFLPTDDALAVSTQKLSQH